MKGHYSLQGLVFGADVEADLPSSDGERVHGVVLHHHLGILGRSQLDEGLDRHTEAASVLLQTTTKMGAMLKIAATRESKER